VSYGDVRQQIGAAIAAIADGGFWASPQVMRSYLDTTASRAGMGHRNHTLTLRENQVLELLQKRYSNKEVARLLGISESTAKFHVSNVLAKVNVTSRRELALNQLSLTFSQTVFRRGCKREDRRRKGKMLVNA
jgi:DNA-binding NarL/FixJ family response regulator